MSGITELLLLQHQIVSKLDQIYEAFPSKVAGAWLVFSEDGYRGNTDERVLASRVARSSDVAPSSRAGGKLPAPPADPEVTEWELV